MESTIIRQVNMTAMLVGPTGPVADLVTQYFAQARVTVVRVVHASAGCERMAVSMPQVVVVLGTLLMYIDPELDSDTLRELVGRAAQAAIDRKLVRDESGPAGTVSEPPTGDDDLDSKW